MVGEEKQIASELAHVLVQRLFDAGLELNAAHKSTSDPKARELIESALNRLDDCINMIRSATWARPPNEGPLP